MSNGWGIRGVTFVGLGCVALVAVIARNASTSSATTAPSEPPRAYPSALDAPSEHGFHAQADSLGVLVARGSGFEASIDPRGWLSIGGEEARFAVRTTAIDRRSDAAAKLDARHPEVGFATSHGVAERPAGPSVERVHARDRGVEQTWTFAEEPPGDGDLRIRLDVRGPSYVGSSDTGLRFADASGRRFVYGRGTWIDARGTRTPVATEWVGDHIELRVASRVMAASAYPAVLDPILGPELGIDGSAQLAQTRNGSVDVACTNGGSCLAVWSRDGLLLGSLVDADGVLANPTGIRLSDSLGVACVSVATTSKGFGVAFVDSGRGVQLSMVSYSGFLANKDILINGVLDPSWPTPTVAIAEADDLLIAWTTATDVVAARVDLGLAVRDTTPLSLSGSGATPSCAPTVATNRNAFLVAWCESANGASGLRARTVDRNGALGGAIDLGMIDPTPNGVDAVWDPVTFAYLVASEGHGAFIQPSGAILPGAGFTAPTALASDGTTVQGLSTTGSDAATQLLLATRTSDTTWTNGISVAALGAAIPYARFVWNGSRFLAFGFSASLSWLVTVPPGATTVGAPTPVGFAAPSQAGVGGAWNGQSYWLAWVERAADGTDAVLARRVARDGTILDATPKVLQSPASWLGERPIRIACTTAGRCLAVWNRVDTVYGSRLDADGTVLDPQPRLIRVVLTGTVLLEPSVASDGSDFFVTWMAQSYSAGTRVVAGRRMTSGGTVDSDDLTVATSVDGIAPIAFAGSYFVPWSKSGEGVYVTRVGVQGNVLDAVPIPLCASSNGRCDLVRLGGADTATDGDVVSVDLSGSEGSAVMRVKGDGTVLDAAPIATGSSASHAGIVVAPLAGDLLVGVPNPTSGPWPRTTFVLSSLSPGSSTPTSVGPISPSPGYAFGLDLISGPAQEVLAVHQRLDETPEYGFVYRIRGSRISALRALGESCGLPSECVSNACVGDMCVDPSAGADGGVAGDAGTRARPSASYCALGRGGASVPTAALPLVVALVLAVRRRRSVPASVRLGGRVARLVRTFLVALALGSGATAAADEPTPTAAETEDYDSLIRRAVAEFDADRFEEARALFHRAHELQPNARTLRGIGMTSFELRDYVDAAVSFQASLADRRRALTSDQRRQTEDLLRQAREFVSRHPVVLLPADAAILVDGVPATVVDGELWLNPGMHQLRVEAPGFETRSEPMQATSGPGARIAIELVPTGARPAVASAMQPATMAPSATPTGDTPAREPSAATTRPSRRRWGFALVGVGAAVAGGGMLAGGLVLRAQDDRLASYCGASVGLPAGRCIDDPAVADAEQTIRIARSLGYTSLGVGLATAATGATLLVLGTRGSDAPTSRTTPTAACDATGCMVGVAGHF